MRKRKPDFIKVLSNNEWSKVNDIDSSFSRDNVIRFVCGSEWIVGWDKENIRYRNKNYTGNVTVEDIGDGLVAVQFKINGRR